MDESATVLLVEDDPAHAELVARALRADDFRGRLVHVGDGARALDYLHRRGRFQDADAAPRPRVVLLDLRLPTVDGFDVLDAIKSCDSLCTIPVVVLSTSRADGDVAHAYHLGANGYLVKPVDVGGFQELIAGVHGYWLEWNQCPWS